MQRSNLTKTSIVATAVWFGFTAMFLTGLILFFWRLLISRVTYAPALAWSFALGAVVGVLIWHAPLFSSASYKTAAIRGALIGPLSLVAALISSMVVDNLLGVQEIHDMWSWVLTAVYAVALTLG